MYSLINLYRKTCNLRLAVSSTVEVFKATEATSVSILYNWQEITKSGALTRPLILAENGNPRKLWTRLKHTGNTR